VQGAHFYLILMAAATGKGSQGEDEYGVPGYNFDDEMPRISVPHTGPREMTSRNSSASLQVRKKAKRSSSRRHRNTDKRANRRERARTEYRLPGTDVEDNISSKKKRERRATLWEQPGAWNTVKERGKEKRRSVQPNRNRRAPKSPVAEAVAELQALDRRRHKKPNNKDFFRKEAVERRRAQLKQMRRNSEAQTANARKSNKGANGRKTRHSVDISEALSETSSGKRGKSNTMRHSRLSTSSAKSAKSAKLPKPKSTNSEAMSLHSSDKSTKHTRLHSVSSSSRDASKRNSGGSRKLSDSSQQDSAGMFGMRNEIDSHVITDSNTTDAKETSGASSEKEGGELSALNASYNSIHETQSHSWEIEGSEIHFEEKIGHGAVCTVYYGTYRGQEVALKVLKEITNVQLDIFQKELEIICNFRSPDVVFFFGCCLKPKPLLVLAYCNKGSLYDVLNSPEEELNMNIVCKICMQTARGLSSLHNWRPQIVHRDLKSRNILLEDNWVVKLCDFGESRFIERTDSSQSKIRGTFAYVAQEIYNGQNYTTKSDVYAFGVILWEMCCRIATGVYSSPFSEYKAKVRLDYQILVQACKLGLRPAIHKDTPSGLANIVSTCWQHEPEARPSADELFKHFSSLLKSDVPADYETGTFKYKAPKITEEAIAYQTKMRGVRYTL